MKSILMKAMMAMMVLGLLFAAGCGGGEEVETGQQQADQAAPEAEAAAPVISFASDCTWPPMEFLDADKNIVGFTIDLVNAMAATGEFEAQLNNVAWDGIFAGLIAGKYDVVASSVSITEERQATMGFSDPYFEVKQGVVVQAGSGIGSEADLSGKTIGGQIGTTGYFAAEAIEGAQTRSYDEVGLAIQDLANGRLDAVICDDAVAADYALTNPEFSETLDLAFLIEADTPEYFGFAVQKDDEATLTALNNALAAVRASGEYDRIYQKWFGGIN